MAFTKEEEQILNASKELHRRSELPAADRWFRRAEIARQLAAPSSQLNPSRIGALEGLVVAGHMLKRQKPEDKRSLPQYRLP